MNSRSSKSSLLCAPRASLRQSRKWKSRIHQWLKNSLSSDHRVFASMDWMLNPKREDSPHLALAAAPTLLGNSALDFLQLSLFVRRLWRLMNSDRESSGILAAGGITAVLASSCCLGPLVLVLLGASGAWIGNLAALEPYRFLFLGLTLAALTLAGFRIFRPTKVCVADGVCASPQTRFTQKVFFSVVAALALIALLFPFLAHLLY